MRFFFILCLFMMLLSCQEQSSERVCEPSTQEGCPEGFHCTLNALGNADCYPIPEEPILIGERCRQSEECEQGASCIMNHTEARCHLFCSTENQKLGRQQCQQRLGDISECKLMVNKREDLGLCTMPCDLEASESCDLMSHCAVPLGESYARCIISGESILNQGCEHTSQCQAGLSCVQDRSVSRCQTLVSRPYQCPPGEVIRYLPWARDPSTGGAYRSCWPDVALQTNQVNGQHYRLRFGLIQQDEAQAQCASLHVNAPVALKDPILIEALEPSSQEQLINEIKGLLNEAQVGLSSVWFAYVNQIEQVQMSPNESCQRYDLISKKLEPTPCELELPILCIYHGERL